MRADAIKPIAACLGVGGVLGAAVAAAIYRSAASALVGAVVGAIVILGGAFLLGRHFHLQDQRRKKELPPEIRGVFDRMLGAAPGGWPGSCPACGGPRAPGDGLQCRSCTEFLKANANSTIHACGGCGTGFLVEPGVNVYAFTANGVSRVFCACCQEHVRSRVTGGTVDMPPVAPGYDAEGQRIVAMHPGVSPEESLRFRTHEAQLRTVINSKARRTGVSNPTPMFVSGG